jgi:hypothetical protein
MASRPGAASALHHQIREPRAARMAAARRPPDPSEYLGPRCIGAVRQALVAAAGGLASLCVECNFALTRKRVLREMTPAAWQRQGITFLSRP